MVTLLPLTPSLRIHPYYKLLPLYGVQKSIAIIRKRATIWTFLVNDDEGLTGKGFMGRR